MGPLGWGRLTGKIGRGKPIPPTSRLHATADAGPQMSDDYLYRVVDAIETVANEVDATVPQVAIAWLLTRPTVANVIVGARDEAQLTDNLRSIDVILSADQIGRLDIASDVPLAYPYWHQRGFTERNPAPV